MGLLRALEQGIIRIAFAKFHSTYPYNFSIYHINKICLGYFGQTGHANHLATDGNDECCSPVDDQVVDINYKITIQSADRRIVSERVLCFGHTYGKVFQPKYL